MDCQGEVGSAAAMAVAGFCATLKGTNEQVENAAEIALDNCIEAIRQTGEEMNTKYRETSLGGIAVNLPAC